MLKPMLHLAHLMPYNLSRAQPREKETGGKEGEHGVGERGGRGIGREGAGKEGEKERERFSVALVGSPWLRVAAPDAAHKINKA